MKNKTITSWDENLQYRSEAIIEAFVNVLLSCKNASKFNLKIGLIEIHTLIAYALKHEICKIVSNQSLTSVYLNWCAIKNKWSDIFVNWSKTSSLCLDILNCQIEVFGSILSLKGYMLGELFVHSSDNITSDDVKTILSIIQLVHFSCSGYKGYSGSL